MERTATAVWKGSGKEGSGHLTTQSEVLKESSYTWRSRFEQGKGTNPEELIGAAFAGCFTMKLSFIIGEAGITPDELTTKATVKLENGTIPEIHFSVTGKVKGATEDDFKSWCRKAKETCPVSTIINTNVTLETKLLKAEAL